MARLLQPSLDSSPRSTSTTDEDRTFAGRGYQFIPLRRAHLDFLAFVFSEEPPPIEQCIGRTLVDRNFLPLGFCLAWLRPEGTVTVHAHFGEWLKRYPKDILKGMKPIIDRVRAAGVAEVWAVADERVAGSRTLVRWFGGVPSGQWVDDQGEYWRVDLARSPI